MFAWWPVDREKGGVYDFLEHHSATLNLASGWNDKIALLDRWISTHHETHVQFIRTTGASRRAAMLVHGVAPPGEDEQDQDPELGMLGDYGDPAPEFMPVEKALKRENASGKRLRQPISLLVQCGRVVAKSEEFDTFCTSMIELGMSPSDNPWMCVVLLEYLRHLAIRARLEDFQARRLDSALRVVMTKTGGWGMETSEDDDNDYRHLVDHDGHGRQQLEMVRFQDPLQRVLRRVGFTHPYEVEIPAVLVTPPSGPATFSWYDDKEGRWITVDAEQQIREREKIRERNKKTKTEDPWPVPTQPLWTYDPGNPAGLPCVDFSNPSVTRPDTGPSPRDSQRGLFKGERITWWSADEGRWVTITTMDRKGLFAV